MANQYYTFFQRLRRPGDGDKFNEIDVPQSVRISAVGSVLNAIVQFHVH